MECRTLRHWMAAAGVLLGLVLARDSGAQGATVSPSSGTTTAAVNSSGTVTFEVANTSTQAVEYTLWCGVSNAVSGCSVSETLFLAVGASETVSVAFTTAGAGAGTVWLTVEGGWRFATIESGEYHVTVGNGGAAVTVTSNSGNPTTIESGQSGNFLFTVHHSGPTSGTYSLSLGCAGLVACSITSPVTVTLAPNGHAVVSTTATGSNQSGSAQLTLTASGPVTGAGNHTVSVWRTGVVSLVRYGDKTIRSGCPTFGAGPQAAVQCGDLLFAHGFPAYRSMNKSRSISLLYNSATARPIHTFALDYTTYPGDPILGRIRVTLKQGTIPVATAYFDASNWDYSAKRAPAGDSA